MCGQTDTKFLDICGQTDTKILNKKESKTGLKKKERKKKEEERKKKSRNIKSPTFIGLGDLKKMYSSNGFPDLPTAPTSATPLGIIGSFRILISQKIRRS